MSFEIVKMDAYKVAKHDPRHMAQVLRMNTGGATLRQFDLRRVTLPNQGHHWLVPTISGDLEPRKELTGVIVAWHEARVYWAFPMGESQRPDCVSPDAIEGRSLSEHGPGGKCATCPLAQFGSSDKGEGRGQACQMRRDLFLWTPDSLLPWVVSLPPTSHGACSKYFLGLAESALPFTHVETAITLETDKNADGVEYCRAKFTARGLLSDADRERFRALANELGPVFRHEAERVPSNDPGWRTPQNPSGSVNEPFDDPFGNPKSADEATPAKKPRAKKGGARR